MIIEFTFVFSKSKNVIVEFHSYFIYFAFLWPSLKKVVGALRGGNDGDIPSFSWK